MSGLQEKIEKLSRCKFDYEIPDILLSVEEIKLNLEEGTEYTGAFTITNSKHTDMKGIVYSSGERITFFDNQFNGEKNEIRYKIDGREFTTGENYNASITVITNWGEVIIPVFIQVVSPFYTSFRGNISDLTQFTGLGKEDWNGALDLFVSPEFERIFLHNNTEYKLIYNSLMKSASPDRAMEEFLIAIHEKTPVHIEIDKQEFEYEIDGKESFMDKITITKDSWGYVEIETETDSSFLTLEHSRIDSENFTGSTYNQEFVIDPALLRDGNNFGRIYIRTYNQEFIVNITCHSLKDRRDTDEHHLLHRKNVITLMKLYLKFRQGRIELHQYAMEVEGILQNNRSENHRLFYDLYETYLAIMTGQDEKAEEFLRTLLEYEKVHLKTPGVEYCTYLYLKALYQKDQEQTGHAVREIRYIYENGHKDYRILWFLLYLDKNYEENVTYKLAQIKEQVLSGTHSPVLYFEALGIFDKQPSLLHELGEFEIQVMNYGIRYDCIQKETAVQFTYLATREKTFHYTIFKNLVMLYEKYYTEEILTGICTMLIKGQKADKKYFPWYRLGVEAQLKITGIHESYMNSIDEDKNIILSSPILMYFMYNSNLSDNKKAYLYAYIIKNKVQNSSIYRTYLKQMENFCLKQIGLHNINRNLSVIYEDILTKEMITESIAYDLPYIMFCQRIQCDNKKIKGAVAVHEELNEECYVPFINGEASVNIFSENARIYLIDYNENRYLSSIGYKTVKLMNWDSFIDTCYYSYYIDNYMLLLALSGRYDKNHRYHEDAMIIREKVMHLPDLRREYYKKYLSWVIQYHYDFMDKDYFLNNLAYFDMDSLNKCERIRVLEYFIVCAMYKEVFSLIRRYGCEELSKEKLFCLCKGFLAEKEDLKEEYQDELEKVCFQCFKAGRYDQSVLSFLIEHYNGTTKDMYELWKICKESKLMTTSLEERLLYQMLFGNSYVNSQFEVFQSYYKEGHNRKLIKGFLSFYGYQYLVHNRTVPKELFLIIQKEIVITEYDIYVLAVLKNLSGKKELNEDELKFARHYVDEFIKKGFSLPFFRNFKKDFLLPSYIGDKCYVQYAADPDKKVVIHYRRKDRYEEEFTTSIMENVYHGIHVKDFLLFYDEELEYYITEEDKEEHTKITVLKGNRPVQETESSNCNTINLMVMTKELKDDKTLVQLMKDYLLMEHTKTQLFNIK